MLLPTIMPTELLKYSSAKDETELFSVLSANPLDFIPFFINACEDETWCENHSTFLSLALEWITANFLKGQLTHEMTSRLCNAIQPHFSTLNPFLPSNVTINIKKDSFSANALLLAAQSDYFHHAVQGYYLKKTAIVLNLTKVSPELLKKTLEFLNTGSIQDLWKYGSDDLIQLIHLAKQWNITPLAKLAEDTLKKYISRDNAIDFLILAQKESWMLFKEYCCVFINEQQLGIKIHPHFAEEHSFEIEVLNPLSFEFIDFSEVAKEIFEKLKPLITHLIIGGSLTENSYFKYAVEACPQLICVDISRTRSYSEWLVDLPRNLKELDVSKCSWLTNAILKKLITICPQLKKIFLGSNVQLNFMGWVELQKLGDLRAIDLSRCHQLHDDDFALILKASSKLTELNVEECRHLSERAFLEISKHLPLLASLNVSRTFITDSGLVDILSRCRHVRALNIARCKLITEKGLIQAVKNNLSLQQINLRYCSISSETINKLKSLKRGIKITN